MKTLELKDICGYLPYELNVMEENKIRKSVGIYHGSYDFEEGYSSPENGNITQLKPILRPMSDLAKEITHRGETFVPIVYMIKSTNFFGLGRNVPKEWLEDDWCVAELVHNCEPCMCVPLFDKLSEWMFDYRGLTPAGLAIDVNTLPENPYER